MLFFGRKKIQKGRLNFPSFMPSFSPSIHWVLLRLWSHAFCHSEPVLFFSPPLFLPRSISPLVGGGAGAWGLLQTFACAACLTFIPIQRNGSVLPTRVSHVSSEAPAGASQQQGDKAQTMGCHLSKMCCFDEDYQR